MEVTPLDPLERPLKCSRKYYSAFLIMTFCEISEVTLHPSKGETQSFFNFAIEIKTHTFNKDHTKMFQEPRQIEHALRWLPIWIFH